MLCNLENCEWYDKAKPGGRKCYYGEPQCWKGWVDLFIGIIKLRFGRDK